jgi:hypothetical protein
MSAIFINTKGERKEVDIVLSQEQIDELDALKKELRLNNELIR